MFKKFLCTSFRRQYLDLNVLVHTLLTGMHVILLKNITLMNKHNALLSQTEIRVAQMKSLLNRNVTNIS